MDEELEALDPPAIVHSTTGGQIDNTPVKVDENV